MIVGGENVFGKSSVKTVHVFLNILLNRREEEPLFRAHMS